MTLGSLYFWFCSSSYPRRSRGVVRGLIEHKKPIHMRRRLGQWSHETKVFEIFMDLNELTPS